MTINVNRVGINELAVTKGNDLLRLTRFELEELLENVRPSSSGTIILPSDFSDSLADQQRDRWDGGKLRAVLHALPEGKRVHIVTDSQTGHTQFNVELVRITGPVSMHNGPEDRLTVRFHHHLGADGPGFHDTSYSTRNLGAIMVPAESAVKWDALHFWREEGSRAMAVARPVAETQHGQTYGRWQMRLTRDGVRVTYTPQRPDGGPNGYGDVVGGELRSWSTYGGYDGPLGSYRDLDQCDRCGRRASKVHVGQSSLGYPWDGLCDPCLDELTTKHVPAGCPLACKEV